MSVFTPSGVFTSCTVAEGSINNTRDGSTSTGCRFQENQSCGILWYWGTAQDITNFEIYADGYSSGESYIIKVEKMTAPYNPGDPYANRTIIHQTQTNLTDNTWTGILRGYTAENCYGIWIWVQHVENMWFDPWIKEVRATGTPYVPTTGSVSFTGTGTCPGTAGELLRANLQWAGARHCVGPSGDYCYAYAYMLDPNGGYADGPYEYGSDVSGPNQFLTCQGDIPGDYVAHLYVFKSGCTTLHASASCHVNPGYTLTLTVSPAAAYQDGCWINANPFCCYGSPCSCAWPSGQVVSLTAVDVGDYRFDHWSGACSGTSRTCSVTMTSDKSVTAVYLQIPKCYITAGYTGQGTVTVTPGGCLWPQECDCGTQITIRATPAAGYRFNGWSGSGTGSYTGMENPHTMTLNADISETAQFVVIAGTTGGIDINGSVFYASFSQAQQDALIAQIRLMNTGDTDGIIYTKYYYQHPTQGWLVLAGPFQQTIAAGDSTWAFHRGNIPDISGSIKFGVKVWGEDESEPPSLLVLGQLTIW